jgi:hypothetical protein
MREEMLPTSQAHHLCTCMRLCAHKCFEILIILFLNSVM